MGLKGILIEAKIEHSSVQLDPGMLTITNIALIDTLCIYKYLHTKLRYKKLSKKQ